MRKAFLWSAAVAYLFIVLMSPLEITNMNEDAALDVLEKETAAGDLQAAEYNLIFEAQSVALNAVRQATVNATLSMDRMEAVALSALSDLRESFLRFIEARGIEGDIRFPSVTASESQPSSRYDLVLLQSQGIPEDADLDGAISLTVKVAYSLRKDEVATAAGERALVFVCPYRMFLVDRVVNSTLSSIHSKAESLSRGETVLDTFKTEVLALISHLSSQLKQQYEGREIAVTVACEVVEDRRGNQTYAVVYATVGARDTSHLAACILKGEEVSPGVSRSATWIFLLRMPTNSTATMPSGSTTTTTLTIWSTRTTVKTAHHMTMYTWETSACTATSWSTATSGSLVIKTKTEIWVKTITFYVPPIIASTALSAAALLRRSQKAARKIKILKSKTPQLCSRETKQPRG